jgi:uncharacterized protein YlxW (UPF0749 family)
VINPFSKRNTNESWVIPVSLMCLLLGFMVSFAWVGRNTRGSRNAYLRADQRTRVSESEVDLEAYHQSEEEVKKLQEEKTKLESALSKRGDDSKVLNDSLQEMKAYACLTDVEGPGVIVTLNDRTQHTGTPVPMGVGENPDSVIHDRDVLHTVNELFASGAEAISVNNHRIANPISIRCVGTTILINDVKVASPLVIRAIGDPDTLYGAMNMPGGELSEIRVYEPSMVQLERVKKLRVPAYTGTTTLKWAKVVAPKEKSVSTTSGSVGHN